MFNKLAPLRSLVNLKQTPYTSPTLLSVIFNQSQSSAHQTIVTLPTESEAARTTFLNVLKHYGFKETDCLKIISADPQVMTIVPSELDDVLARWNQTKLGNEYVNLLILNHPLYLYASAVVIEKRMPLLQAFVKKPKNLLLLLLKCPNVLTEQWEQIQAKIDYLEDVMRVEHDEILKSAALNKTLDHIKLRHNLLLKCGMYQTPTQYEHKKVKSEKSSFRNPHLKRIVDNENISFARKICKISMEEYEAYCEVFAQELKELEKDEYLSDSDDDE